MRTDSLAFIEMRNILWIDVVIMDRSFVLICPGLIIRDLRIILDQLSGINHLGSISQNLSSGINRMNKLGQINGQGFLSIVVYSATPSDMRMRKKHTALCMSKCALGL